MSVPTLSSITYSFGITRDVSLLRAQMEDLQRQLGTGKRSETYGGLGHDRWQVLSLRARMATIDGYRQTISQAEIRLNAVQEHLERVRQIGVDMRTDALDMSLKVVAGGQAEAQLAARDRLDEMVGLLNFELGGRHAFSGRAADTRPVPDARTLIDGIGARAGLRQVIAERRAADLGAAGLGRLDVTRAGAAVTLAEDGAGHPFGFKLDHAASTLSGTTVSGPAGVPPAVDVSFSATLPNAGERLTLMLALSDGTSQTVVLEATHDTPPGPGAFTIGADADTTAANFEAALGDALGRVARSELAAASAVAAADAFFFDEGAGVPLRVDGPPFDTATALVAGTAADTVFWYQGENGPGSARASAVARVDDTLTVDYGTRANEKPLATVMSAVGVLAAEAFDEADVDDPARYAALAGRVAQKLTFPGQQSVDGLISELGHKQVALGRAEERHAAARNVAMNLLQDTEGVDPYEISAKLLTLSTRLEASLATTRMLADLTLVRYL